MSRNNRIIVVDTIYCWKGELLKCDILKKL